MSSENDRSRELFNEALERPESEREAFLAVACADDPAMSQQVRELLAAFEESEQALEPASLQTAPPPAAARPHGTRIGRYHLRRLIGSGGMGAVYEATQEHPRRTVALKLMKQGIASRGALRRFEYEAQILARLRHPGIAQIFEAGTHQEETGTIPYFAMEYIPAARTLTDWAAEQKLGTRQRLELFASICDAVHHGHQKGIIHRDLKPSNILVDSEGQPKIIDFGVARATDSDLAVTTLQTDIGQLIGTVQYMSPEQCAADPHDIDTRSDVYSLGVVLYELLCEQLPYDLRRTPLHEATRVIREQSPPRPSTTSKALRGDVETIVLKAMEKQRGRRYQSAAELAADIRRYLRNEPILARPPSIVYQVSMFARRHRAATAALSSVFLVLLVAVVAVTISRNQTAAALRETEASLARIRKHLSQSLPFESSKYLIVPLENHERPAHGGRHILLFPARHNEGQGRLFFVDDSGRTMAQLPETLPLPEWAQKGQPAESYWAGCALVEDVLPENPGRELVVGFSSPATHLSRVVVLDLEMNPLRELWSLGRPSALGWDEERRVLLVLANAPLLAQYVPELAPFDSMDCPKGQLDAEVIFAIRPENLKGLLAPLKGDKAPAPARVEWAFGLTAPPQGARADRRTWRVANAEVGPANEGAPEALARLAMHWKVDGNDVWGVFRFDSSGRLLGPPQFHGDRAAPVAPVVELVPVDLNHLTEAVSIAEPLMVRTGSLEETQTLLNEDGSLSAEVRADALRAAEAMSNNWRWLHVQADQVASAPGAGPQEHALALRMARAAVQVHQERCPAPDSCYPGWYAWNVLAGVQYASGDYHSALETFAHCDAVWSKLEHAKGQGNALDVAHLAMCRFQLGQFEQARSELARAQRLLLEYPPLNLHESAVKAVGKAQEMLKSVPDP